MDVTWDITLINTFQKPSLYYKGTLLLHGFTPTPPSGLHLLLCILVRPAGQAGPAGRPGCRPAPPAAAAAAAARGGEAGPGRSGGRGPGVAGTGAGAGEARSER